MGYPTQQQKVDYLFKKIGFSASKTGVAEDQTSGFSGDTKKAPPNEAIPSPLVVPASSLWADTSYIPATPPTSSNGYVGVYSTATAYRMTVDTSVSNNRAFVARSTWGNHSSAINGDWIDTQFGANYLIKVYKGDPSVGTPGVAYTNITAAGTGGGPDDTWFFDYSSGVLNFNGADLDGQLVGIHTDNVYIVGYRYLGTKGVQPAAGIGTFNSLHVTGIATFKDDVEFHGSAGVTSAIWDKSENLLNFKDHVKATFGTGNDLAIYHDNSHSYLEETGTGALKLKGDDIRLENSSGLNIIKAVSPAAEIYYSGSKKFETLQGGVGIGGSIHIDNDLYVTGISTLTDDVRAGANLSVAGLSTFTQLVDINGGGQANTFRVEDLTSGRVVLAGTNGELEDSANLTFNGTVLALTGNQTISGTIDVDGRSELDNVNIAETLNVVGVSTFNDDVNFIGAASTIQFDKSDNSLDFNDNARIRLGNNSDIQIYHNSSDSFGYISNSNTEPLRITGALTQIRNTADNANIADFHQNTGVQLYCAGVKKFQTTGIGVSVIGNTKTDTLNVTGVSTLTGNVITSGDVQFTGDNYNAFWDKSVNSLQFSDNAKATFGSHAGAGDFQIYHDGSTSIIKSGEGNLNLQTVSGEVLLSNTAGEFGVSYKHNDRVLLRYDNADRFQTTGIGATIFGKTETQSLNVSGIATFSGTVSAASSTGVSGQVLQSTGVGVTWATQPQARSTVTFTATEGQTGFSFNYNVNYLDVFVNGIKLTASEYTATNGTVVTLDTGCVVGDIVELYSYNIVSGTVGGSGGASILNDLNDVSLVGTPVAGESIQYNGTSWTNDYISSTITNGTSIVALHTVDVTKFRTVEWTIQATRGSNYHTTKILAIHNGSNTTNHTEFATLIIGSSLATYNTDIDSGGNNMRLLVTPSSATTTTFKTTVTMIKV